MGANVSVAQNNVSQKIIQELDQNAGASANASCSITLGPWDLSGMDNCNFKAENHCTANATASLGAVAKAAAKAVTEAQTQQETVLPLLGFNASMTQQQIQTDIETRLNQKCQANATLAQEIIQQGIKLKGCKNSNITFANAGNASGNCGITAVMNSISEAYAESETGQSSGNVFGAIGNMFASGGIYMMAFYCICCCICCILLVMMGIAGFMYTKVSSDVESGKFDSLAESAGK